MAFLESKSLTCCAALMFALLWMAVPSLAIAQVPDSTVTCAPATAEAYLDIGNVRASVFNDGAIGTRIGVSSLGGGSYESPKGGGVHALAGSNLILGGLVDGDLRMAGSMSGPAEFWPGPISAAEPSSESCADYDQLWEVLHKDLSPRDGLANGRIQSWPVAAGAPFSDVDGDGLYDPDTGDRPEMLGDQQLWWVMNDTGGAHANTKTLPIGVEIRAAAFAFDVPGAVGNTTFYRYSIRNASTQAIDSTFAGLFFDPYLGAPWDDFMGSDSTLGLGFAYNADDNDEGFYGPAPPALGATVLRRPSATGLCRYPDDKDVGFTNIHPHKDGFPDVYYPNNASQYYNVIQSRWTDGAPLTAGGPGRGDSEEHIRYMFPGDPVTGTAWSQVNWGVPSGRGSAPGNMSFFAGLGPFCMAPGEEVELVIAIVWSRGSSNLDSVRQLKEDVAYIQSIRDEILTPRVIPEQNVPEPEVPFAVGVYPNPAGTDGATVRLSIPEALDVGVDVYDLLGRRVHVAAGAGRLGGGEHQWSLPTGTWAPGVYLVRIQAGPAVTTRRLVVSNDTE